VKIREICGLVLSVHDRAAIQLGFRPSLLFVLATPLPILMLQRLKSFSFGMPTEFACKESSNRFDSKALQADEGCKIFLAE
jgi:hypothetical protein